MLHKLSKFKKLFQCILNAKELCLLYHFGYLKDVGWFESRRKGSSIDKNGNPIPWLAYPFLDFIHSRLNKHFNVFEYGSGNSTLGWANKCNLVMSCEHDKQWFLKMNELKPKNVTLIFKELEYDGDYSKEILNYTNYFDIIVIDGRDRVNCAKNSLNALKEKGVIVWDNSDREEYRKGYKFLEGNGFKRIDFFGVGPINIYKWCTSLFYREEIV